MSGDQGARRQIRERLDATMLVEAGAGTGKTRALVDRILALVGAGIAVDRIAAITFTEKAAAELRDRIRDGLERAIGEQPDTAEAFRAAVATIDRAQISTIHAYCQGLLRAFAAEAGVDPEFTVLDELAAERRFEERWRAFLEACAPPAPEAAAIDRVLGLGMGSRDLHDLAHDLSGRVDLARGILEAPPAPVPEPDWTSLPALHDELSALPLDRVAGDDLLLIHVGELSRVLERLLGAADTAEREALLAGAGPMIGRKCGQRGRAGNWGGRDGIAAARGCVGAVGEALCAALARARSAALADLLPAVARFVVEDAEARRRAGTLDFDDLILLARDLMRNPVAARELRRRDAALLIDEFQDTDPWQAEIAAAFATDPATGRLEPGRLFLVGDPKQSIYRFRRADMAVYADARERVAGEGGLLPELALNRRSRRVVLDWVNAVFAPLIGDGAEPRLQPPYRPIHHERDPRLAGPGVAVMGRPRSDTASQVRAAESREVAAACRAAVEEPWQVDDPRAGVRPARLGDIAVLIPTRTGLGALERALGDAGVPYRVEGGSLVYRTQELRDLINCLAAIDDPSDEVAVVAALRSPAFACSDLDLALHRREGGSFHFLAPGLAPGDGPVSRGLLALRRHHEGRHRGSLASVVEGFVAERRLVEVGLVDARDRDAHRRARFVVEQARAFEAAGPQGLRSFVAWMEERSAAVMLEREGSGLDDDEDAVRVLTIHGAKGLEFPIVILAGLGTAPPYVRRRLGRDGPLAVGVGRAGSRFELGDVAGMAEREERHEAAERARLLYVAATRARDHLVVSLSRREKAAESGAARLEAAGAAAHGPAWVPAPPERAVAAVPLGGLEVDPPPDPTPEGHEAARAKLVARAHRVRYTSATGIARAAAESDERRGAGDEPWSRGRGGTRVGRAVHAAIQSLPLDAGPAEVEAVARAQAVAEAVPERTDEVARLVDAALASAAAGRARGARGALREVPFALARDGAVVEGFIDLVIPGPDGLEIVDWKTDDVPVAGVPERLGSYRLQAGLYALGLRAATGRPVARITYVFLRTGVEGSPGEADELEAAARAGLADAPAG